MILDIKNRLLLISMLPAEGNISQMVDVYDLVRELKLSDEEKNKVAYVESGSYVKWEHKDDPNKDINISSDQLKIIMDAIDKLDREGKISLEMVPLIKLING